MGKVITGPNVTPLSYRRGRGLLVSTVSRPPVTVAEKITTARSIVHAIVSAQIDGESVKVSHVLPFLTMATAYLEEAAAEANDEEVPNA